VTYRHSSADNFALVAGVDVKMWPVVGIKAFIHILREVTWCVDVKKVDRVT
jgi:hypothetical protein